MLDSCARRYIRRQLEWASREADKVPSLELRQALEAQIAALQKQASDDTGALKQAGLVDTIYGIIARKPLAPATAQCQSQDAGNG